MNKESKDFDPHRRYSAEEIGERLLAIHTTDFLPVDGVVHPKTLSDIETEKSDISSIGRPTIHFSLGEMVRPHDGHSWEDRKFAILIPLGKIYQQVININAYDTFSFGSLTLPPGTIIVIPEGTRHQLPSHISVQTYTKGQGALRKKIELITEEYSFWKTQMNESAMEGAAATIQGHNINRPKFFSDILTKYPHISFGSHLASETSGFAGDLGMISKVHEHIIRGLLRFSNPLSIKETIFYRAFLTRLLKRVLIGLRKMDLPRNEKDRIDTEERRTRRFIKALDLFLYAFSKGKYLADLDDQTIIHLFEKLDILQTVEDIYKWISPQLSRLSPFAYDSFPETRMADFMYGVKGSELSEFIYELTNGPLPIAINQKSLVAHTQLRRLLLLEPELPEAKETLKRFLSHSLQFLDAKDLWPPLIRYIERGSSRLSVITSILNDPTMREKISTFPEIKFPQKQLQTFEDILQIYDSEIKPSDIETLEQNSDSQLLHDLKVIERPEANGPKMMDSYLEWMAHNSRVALWYRELLVELGALRKPLRNTKLRETWGDSVDFLDRIRVGRGRPDRTILEVWRRLGLERQYLQMFESEEAFWNSSQSFLDIYEQLKAPRH